MFDAVIKAGTIVDGTGNEPFTGDIAIADGRIVAIGQVDGPARRTFEADGAVVAPGWVDAHTHYHGQVTWDDQLEGSSANGVTTVVMGNCGVGFAPMKPERRQFLIEMMEGVEDIPGAVLAEGVDWNWESFPEYLDALEAKPRIMDLGAQLPHAALRYYVMGERGARNQSMFGTLEPDVYFYGAAIEKTGPDKYRITKGGFTTCVQPTARWEIVSNSATVNLDDYVILRNAVIQVKDVPIFYLPLLYYPIQEDDRATGFLMPQYGSSLAMGSSIGNAFFWAINRSQDATFYHDWFSKGGTP